MLRIRTGARHGLRWGMFGFVAAALFTISSDPSQAAPYADIVVDANSGTVLHSTNPDAQRHPASLTKIMTLYLLFEQLEAGKLKLDSQLQVSKEAAGQMPTKLGLKPGSTLAVEDAIKGMVTRSANDAAVVVAEAIAGDEDAFARLMTRKAQALGMTRTVYKNASGLPDSNQVTTARDQATLGRAVQERFPRYYKYFSIRTFTFRGQSIGNHNHLLGRVEGVDGIKTGYISASGFNLVTSVHRGNRYLVAVVMGGSSAGSRDANMRDLISDKIAQASIKRTAPMVAEGFVPSEAKPEPKAVAKIEAKPGPKVAAKVDAKPEPKAEAKSESNTESKSEARFAVASAISLPARFNSAPAQAEPATTKSESPPAVAQPQSIAGSTDPIRPVLVKTLSVRAGTQTASLAPMNVPSPPVVEPRPVLAAAPVTPPAPPAPVVAVKPEPPAPQPAPVVAAKPEPAPAAPPVAAKIEAPLPALVLQASRGAGLILCRGCRKAEPAVPLPMPSPRAAASATAPARLPPRRARPARTRARGQAAARSGWMIQVGAYHAETGGQAAPLGRAEQGVQDAHRRRCVHRNRR